MSRKLLLWLPFALMAALFGAFYLGLRNPDDHVIASQMVGQQLPEFAAGPAFPEQPGAANTDFRDGKPRLLNIFASWCVPCVAEIPMLMELKASGAEVVGIAVHDNSAALANFLRLGTAWQYWLQGAIVIVAAVLYVALQQRNSARKH